jgi:hypothetical protein
VIRSSLLALLLLAAGPAAAQQSWHGPEASPEPDKRAAVGTPGSNLHLQLGRAIALKFASPEFRATLVPGRLPADSHSVPGEQAVRQARDKIAFARRAPADEKVLVIPRAGAAPRVDGVAGDSEWRGALRLALDPRERKASVLLYVYGGQLYLAALAPGDRTPGGFDQFRFWYHLDLSPFMSDERAMIDGRGGAKTLRGARLPRAGVEIRDGLDPKTFGINPDWGVSARLRGVSTITGFRQYEASVDLVESGLRPGTPFPAYFEIEGDSVMDRGRFTARFIEGEIGSAKEPVWLRVAP